MSGWATANDAAGLLVKRGQASLYYLAELYLGSSRVAKLRGLASAIAATPSADVLTRSVR